MLEAKMYVLYFGKLLDNLLYQNKGVNHEAGRHWGLTQRILLAKRSLREDSSVTCGTVVCPKHD